MAEGGEEEEERRLIDLRLASPQVKMTLPPEIEYMAFFYDV